MDDPMKNETGRPKLTDKELVKFGVIIFVAAVYAWLFLKIVLID